MKKIILLSILVLSLIVTQAQKPYSQENLKNLSQEELDVYFNKALKLQKSGKTVTKVGAITVGVSVLAVLATSETLGMGALLFFIPAELGLGAVAVGVPMNITGKKRVERINTIKNTAYDGIKIDLKPCAQYNLATQNYQPGITLRIRF
ncbi:MAG: hypothetical protein ABFS16_12305 [Bacteroidota bacterium]